MRKIIVLVSLIILTIVACAVDDELFGLFTVAAWALAGSAKLLIAHEEYRSYRAKN